MDFPIYIDTIRMILPIVYFKGSQVEFSKLRVIYVPEDCFILANNTDPDEMQDYTAYHLCLNCVPKYTFRGFQHTKVSQLILS